MTDTYYQQVDQHTVPVSAPTTEVRLGPVLENTKKNQNSDSVVEILFEFLFQLPFSIFDLGQKKFFIEIR